LDRGFCLEFELYNFFKQIEHSFSSAEQLSQITEMLLSIVPLQRKQVLEAFSSANLEQALQSIWTHNFLLMLRG
jgi:hypothetical protein